MPKDKHTIDLFENNANGIDTLEDAVREMTDRTQGIRPKQIAFKTNRSQADLNKFVHSPRWQLLEDIINVTGNHIVIHCLVKKFGYMIEKMAPPDNNKTLAEVKELLGVVSKKLEEIEKDE